MSLQDLLRGLPLLAAPPPADLFGDGPVVRDDLLGLLGSVRSAIGVAEHVGHPSVHDRPSPFSEVGSDHTDRAEMVFAALDHLQVVDAGQLRVDPAGVVGGAVKRGPQQPIARLADRLAFAVLLARLLARSRPGTSPRVKGGRGPSRRDASGSEHP